MTAAEVCIVLGTRPEIIKMAPVIRGLRRNEMVRLHLVHTNQHYDAELSDVFFENLGLSTPDENLNIGSDSQGRQTARALVGVESTLRGREPAAVLAQGDTNTVLAAALATSKLPALFGHVEAGIRSYDRSMPEEINRVVADHISDLLFAPTETAVENLADEGIDSDVMLTGNTVVDACLEHAPIADERSDVLKTLGVESDGYVVATIHRPRNTDDPDRLHRIVGALDDVEFPVVLPAHPRTRAALDELQYRPDGSLSVVEPLDYLDFLKLENHARVIVTDSGGVQEEASILEVPCLTVRPNTERPETIDAGVNRLLEPDEIRDTLVEVYRDNDIHERMTGAPFLYGDGEASRDIVGRLLASLRKNGKGRP